MNKKSFLLAAAVLFSAFQLSGTPFDREFPSWQKFSRKKVFSDSQHKAAGSVSVRIENGGTLQRYFDLKPDTEYELTFYVKGKNIDGSGDNGARIMLYDGKKKWGRFSSDQYRSKPDSGTFDWRLGKGVIKSAEWGKRIRISLALRGKGTVWFDEVYLKETGKTEKIKSFRQTFTDGYQQLALVPGGCLGFFEPGEKVEFTVYSKSKSKNLEYALTVKDENNRLIFTVPRKKLDAKFSIPGQPAGYYVVSADFYADGKKARSLQSAFTVSKQFQKRDPFFQVGFGAHQSFHEALKRIGAGAICLKFSWQNLNTTPASYWKYNYESKYKRFIESGDYELIACIGCAIPRKFISQQQQKDGYPLLSDRAFEFRRQYIDLALKTLNGKVKTWQFQNEIPSSATIKHKFAGTWSEAMFNFAILTRMGARQVRKTIPDAFIRAGGNNVQKNLKTIEPIVLGDIVDDFDQYFVDAYTGNWDLCKGKCLIPEVSLMSFYQEASALAASLGKSKYIGNAESGYCIPYGSPFDQGLAITQAEMTSRLILISKAGPVSFFEIHKPGDPLISSKEPNDTAGCMNTVWKPVWFGKKYFQVPLPGSAVYATAAHELSFTRNHSYFHEDRIYGASFEKADGSTLLVLWNIEKAVPFTFDFPSEVRMVNMYGRESRLPAGKHTLTLSPSPVYLTMKTPVDKLTQQVKKAFADQTPKFRCTGYFTGKDTAQIFIRNLSRVTRKGTLQGEKITLLPDKIFEAKVKTAAGKVQFKADSGETIDITPAQGLFQKVACVKSKPVFDGSGSWVKDLPKGTLSYPDDIRPIGALQQELCYFQTPFNPNGHNVSANYWIACDDRNFYFAADVDDPVHLQRHKGVDIWRDDSIQFVFDMGNPVPHELNHPGEEVRRSLLNFGMALTRNGPELVKFLGKDAGLKNYPVKITRRNNRTFYELSIPFSALGGKPDRFGFVIFDNNYVTKKSSPYRLEFSSGVVGSVDSSKLKQLQY